MYMTEVDVCVAYIVIWVYIYDVYVCMGQQKEEGENK